MLSFDDLTAAGLFDRGLPRYTSYPPATSFHAGVGAEAQAAALAALDPEEPVSVYVHIPFCERLCWFCACRTQGVRSLAPVEHYIDTLEAELALLRGILPKGLRMARLHLGGGTPTILPPALITRLLAAIDGTFARAEGFEFAAEIDPTQIDEGRIAALSEAGLARASIGVQDFDPKVQAAIGRAQSFEATRAAVDSLRAAGIGSLNIDLVYGLPHQTLDGLRATLEQVDHLWPDRIALFGYAHVPHMARRQVLIAEETLPDDRERLALFRMAADHLTESGFDTIGIDHFARPRDALALAAAGGRMRRNFQGYTDDVAPTLIGIGASAVSRLPSGYVQNEPRTGKHSALVRDGILPGHRGYAFTPDDRLRARAIEMLLCDFAIDAAALSAEFGQVAVAGLGLPRLAADFADHVTVSGGCLTLEPDARALVRLLAHRLDQHRPEGAQYSRAS